MGEPFWQFAGGADGSVWPAGFRAEPGSASLLRSPSRDHGSRGPGVHGFNREASRVAKCFAPISKSHIFILGDSTWDIGAFFGIGRVAILFCAGVVSAQTGITFEARQFNPGRLGTNGGGVAVTQITIRSEPDLCIR